MTNTSTEENLHNYFSESDEVISKGDTFVQYQPRHTIIFMKVNDVEHTESMDFCSVTWHLLDIKGLNVQSHFPMAAPNGMFWGFAPIERTIHKEALALMRDCDAKIKVSSSDSEKKYFVQKCRRKLIRMIKNQNDEESKYRAR